MRLCRYGERDREKPGLIDDEGQLRDLSFFCDDISPEQLSPAGLAKLEQADVQTLPIIGENQRLGVPLAGCGKVVAIGLNYTDHAEEAGMDIPQEPVIFMKAASCLQGANDTVMVPPGAEKTDWEVELGVVIGTRCTHVPESRALEHVAGYCLFNDVSERSYQMERGGTWDKGKNCDTFGPIGPWIVTANSIPDPQNLSLWLDVNGTRMQSSNTSRMIFSLAKIVSYISSFMTLYPGDVVITGTPAGVGLGKRPPVFLRAGDIVTCGADYLGEQRQTVVAWSQLEEMAV